VVTEASEWAVREVQRAWRTEVLADDRFISNHDEFRKWAEGRGTLRMEYFYRQMRRKTGWLMVTGNFALLAGIDPAQVEA
jgi:deoxyribodipyrimidine photolyase-related protein